MSTQSGITPSSEFLESFKKFVEDEAPILTAEIIKEVIEVGDVITATPLSKAFDALQSQLDDSTPKYIVVRHADNNVYTFISYVPDYAAVKDKMLYASSKNTLIRQLGSELFAHTLFLNSLDEVSYEHWKYSVSGGSSNALSKEEKALNEVKELELDAKIQSAQKRKLVAPTNSLNFKLHANAEVPVEEGHLYSFNIDLNTEEVFLSNSASLNDAKELPSLISRDYPQYNLLKLNGKTYFIFSCPSGSKVKERMMYASNKNSLINHFKQSNTIDKSIEIGDADELELSEFSNEKKVEEDQGHLKFSRPSRPGRRR